MGGKIRILVFTLPIVEHLMMNNNQSDNDQHHPSAIVLTFETRTIEDVNKDFQTVGTDLNVIAMDHGDVIVTRQASTRTISCDIFISNLQCLKQLITNSLIVLNNVKYVVLHSVDISDDVLPTESKKNLDYILTNIYKYGELEPQLIIVHPTQLFGWMKDLIINFTSGKEFQIIDNFYNLSMSLKNDLSSFDKYYSVIENKQNLATENRKSIRKISSSSTDGDD
ncbi:unnamed protein product [Didymodactylos carnosus]|uniref:Uncharacterized protein n=1 Tax=Didymodactylos carnosus TaxID=1234261 RepID=A0A814N4S9_9BILA|nr:unnamed protein product [Didymodactylos carnosus]CAF3853359.1 unnamed protein product [Didymodactylos carnosus]